MALNHSFPLKMLLRNRLCSLNLTSFLPSPSPPTQSVSFIFSFNKTIAYSTHKPHGSKPQISASRATNQPISDRVRFTKTVLFVPPGVDPEDVTDEMILPGSNIVVGPYAGHSQIKEVEFVKSSGRAKDCPKDDRPEFAILGKTQLINHFLVNKSWYIVDLPGYGFAKASDTARTDWSSFTKGYFLNRETLVAVLLLIDASVPPQKIDLDCANWLGRNNIPMTFVFTKCDKMKASKGKRPDENIKDFQEVIREKYKQHPPWIMTSSVTGLGRDELLLHLSQLRNYWDQ
ncbi:GTP-binding protein At2g22870 isoform X2 [Hibiscus syriacus]|uniref:GTP-binding protein At2g22870 isoform X2 n=1 Tax=Hibiscus syriacus TaxID=106335 RepID=UPI0019217843|nr:GTP-binding protein At2g22870 isoform X2 [Hibiscus syriacus]